jgi:hypothetical protein
LKQGFRSGDGVEFSAKVMPSPNYYQGGKFNKMSVNQCNESKTTNKFDTVANYEVYNFPDTTNLNFNDEIIENSLATNVSISLYPNPAESLVNIKLDNYNGGEIECAVYDISGNKVNEMIKCSSSFFVNLHGLASGVYIFRVKYKAMLYYRKISKL